MLFKVLFRPVDASPGEIRAAKNYFNCIESLMQVEEGDLVICRYSCLPFYKELQGDIDLAGGQMINTFKQHNYVADLRNWYQDLEPFTPQTWFRLEDVPEREGPFVLKGKTYSKKHNWKTHMFAQNLEEAKEVYWRLCQDGLIGSEDIYIRKYVPLVRYAEGLNGLPITKEFRVFVLYGQVVCGAYYWTGYDEVIGHTPSFDEVPMDFLAEVVRRVGSKINFYVVDVAQTEEGSWVVVELNDGQMSGLSENNPDTLYKEMKAILSKQFCLKS